MGLEGVKFIVLLLPIAFSMLLIKVPLINAITLNDVAGTGEWGPCLAGEYRPTGYFCVIRGT